MPYIQQTTPIAVYPQYNSGGYLDEVQIFSRMKNAGLLLDWIGQCEVDTNATTAHYTIKNLTDFGFAFKANSSNGYIYTSNLKTKTTISTIMTWSGSYPVDLNTTTIINYFVNDKAFCIYWGSNFYLFIIKDFVMTDNYMIASGGYPTATNTVSSIITNTGTSSISAINYICNSSNLGINKGIKYKPLITYQGQLVESNYNVYFGAFELGTVINNEILFPIYRNPRSDSLYFIGIPLS
ncbi:hypothetical protein [Caloramator proteoclasticus]|uniref:Uncharacterized protein n=1 Tax=Caloramator proteoclasticus DSM 10124 TaxID=1121262 RepID=A0A1M4ZDT4_9CLOT|nr:hypothetical protein [Caloramator proteoclasticus]SHF16115.1 hypothetical protein SAMN02746091_01889 [Caloramator proteoclasticus DSM 10124]